MFSYSKEFILFNDAVMKHDGNLPREKEVQDCDHETQDQGSNPGEQRKVPAPTEVGINKDGHFLGIEEGYFHLRIVQYDDTIGKAGQHHSNTSHHGKVCTQTNNKNKEQNCDEIERKRKPEGKK